MIATNDFKWQSRLVSSNHNTVHTSVADPNLPPLPCNTFFNWESNLVNNQKKKEKQTLEQKPKEEKAQKNYSIKMLINAKKMKI